MRQRLDGNGARCVLHRDIKPANIMVGRYGEVVLMDWGLAKVKSVEGASSQTPSANATQEGTVLGTPAYMPPEQALGHNSQIDERSDIYSASVVFHELLAVRHYLHHCKSQTQLISSILSEKFPYMRLVFLRHPEHPVPPAELLHFVVKGLAKEPADRYQSIDEMLEQLQRIRDGHCPVDCPATLAKRLTDSIGRFLNHYPKLSPFVFYPMLILIVSSVLVNVYQLLRHLR